MIWRGLSFDTSNAEVYQPKPATLFCAEHAIALVKPGERVLEVGTGSGAIAIAIAKFVARSRVTASDINPEAVAATLHNARLNKVKIKVVAGNLYRPFKPSSFDVIIVHPPAVPYPSGRTWGMTKGMSVATNGGPDGSIVVTRSISEAVTYLKPKGRLILLLPHWSNAKKAYEELLGSYSSMRKIAEKKVRFFPTTEGRPTKQLLMHVRKLANEGVIELWEENGLLYSKVSIIEAIK